VRVNRLPFVVLLVCAAAWLGGCVSWFAPPPGIGREVSFRALPGWDQDRHAESWPALRRSCEQFLARATDAAWIELCHAVQAIESPSDAQAREFFETRFIPYVVNGDGSRDGLITGYYEPLLNGSLTRTDRFRYPLYRRPDNLLTIDLTSLYPELKGRPVRGRLDGKRVIPYLDRAQIARERSPLAGNELLWVDDPVEAYLLQVQGSGRVRLPDGSQVAVGYADQNGHPYRSLGAQLIQRGELRREEVTLPRIREWIAAHPEETEALLNSNPSFVFFRLREAGAEGPVGSLGVPLVAERSIAVDPAYITLGLPVWLNTTLPDGSRYQRLVVAQDTGGAIKGAVRADVFFGQGDAAGRVAGEMKQTGQLYVLRPRPPQPVTVLSKTP
jgi:membrane-bound lytic murein transglycosylase A